MLMLKPAACSTVGAAASSRPGRLAAVPPEGSHAKSGLESVGAIQDAPVAVEAFVADLPCQQRVALVQRMFHDRTYAEIGATLCCSEEAARASVYEAIRTLRHRVWDTSCAR